VPHGLREPILLQELGHTWTSFARGACIYTDPFIMMSGLLTSYSFYKQLERKKRLDIPWEYMSRLMRYNSILPLRNITTSKLCWRQLVTVTTLCSLIPCHLIPVIMTVVSDVGSLCGF
jgi:hypothetical protein